MGSERFSPALTHWLLKGCKVFHRASPEEGGCEHGVPLIKRAVHPEPGVCQPFTVWLFLQPVIFVPGVLALLQPDPVRDVCILQEALEKGQKGLLTLPWDLEAAEPLSSRRTRAIPAPHQLQES